MAGEGIAAEGRDVRFEITHLFKYSAGIGVNGKLPCWFIDGHSKYHQGRALPTSAPENKLIQGSTVGKDERTVAYMDGYNVAASLTSLMYRLM